MPIAAARIFLAALNTANEATLIEQFHTFY